MSSIPIEVSIKGRITTVPALCLQGRAIIVTGRWFKMATIHDEEWLSGETLRDPEQLVALLRKNRSGADLFSFASAQPDEDLGYDYHKEWDNVAVIRLGNYDAWWNGLSQDGRRNVRIAEKRDVVVRRADFSDHLVEGIKRIYDETPLRQGRRFWHYGKDIEVVKRDNATYLDRSIFITAHCGDELIGFIKMVRVDKTMRIMQILTKNRHFDKRPANALIAKAVEISSAENMKFLAYCRYVYGNKKNSSITEFKRRNGFEELRFPRYYIPLTVKGIVGLRCKAHLGINDLLPEGVTERLLRIRSLVYAKALGLTKADDLDNRRAVPKAGVPAGE